MTDTTLQLTPLLGDRGMVLAWGRLLSGGEHSIAESEAIPDFTLPGAQALLDQVLATADADTGTFRMIVSDDHAKALADGVLDFVRNADGAVTGGLRDQQGRFAGNVAFNAAGAAGIMTGGQAAVALITLRALAELGMQLRTAFEQLHQQLGAIKQKLDANFNATVNESLSGARTAFMIGQEGEHHLRREGRIPTAVDVGGARYKSIEGWGAAVANIDHLLRKLDPLRQPESLTPQAYIDHLKGAFSYGTQELAARSALLALWGAARIQCETVYELETQRTAGTGAAARDVHDEVVRKCDDVSTALDEIARGRFTKAPPRRKVGEQGLLAKDRPAAALHFQLLDIAADATTILALPQRTLAPRSTVVEISNASGMLTTRATVQP